MMQILQTGTDPDTIPGHQKRIRTTNLLERLFGEGRRRSKVIPQFMNERSGMVGDEFAAGGVGGCVCELARRKGHSLREP